MENKDCCRYFAALNRDFLFIQLTGHHPRCPQFNELGYDITQPGIQKENTKNKIKLIKSTIQKSQEQIDNLLLLLKKRDKKEKR